MAKYVVYLPLVFVNLWHLYLVLRHKVADTISESALMTKRTLLLHRAVHTFGALCFMAYAVFLFSAASEYRFAAVVLAVAAVLDIIQSFVLTSETNHAFGELKDRHQMTAWLMAAGYLLFAVTMAVIEGMAVVAAIAVLLLIGIVLWSHISKIKRRFVLSQMAFFVVVSVVIAINGVLV